LAGSDVKVTFTAASSDGAVLAVPQGAITSDAAGQLSVITVDANNNLARVAVRVGVSGDDLIEIIPLEVAALKEGDRVVIGG
jgi:multidrug efflux pump subunit AcrA (membrane-fusion protein)